MRNVVNGINLTAHGGLIATLAHRYRGFLGGSLEWDDLMQAGWLGLHKAATKFEPERGVKFSTYAGFWIRAFIQRCIMNERRTVRVPVHAQTDANKRGEWIALDIYSLDAPLNADDPGDTWLDTMRSADDTAATAEANEIARITEEAVSRLPPKERRIIKGRYWGDLTLRDVGDDMGVSRERIRQQQADAIERLRHRLGKEGA